MNSIGISVHLVEQLTQIAHTQGLTPDQFVSTLLSRDVTSEFPSETVFQFSPTSAAIIDARQPSYPIIAVNHAFETEVLRTEKV